MMFSQLSQGDPNAFQYSIFSILVAGYIETLTHPSSPYTLKLLLEQPVYLTESKICVKTMELMSAVFYSASQT